MLTEEQMKYLTNLAKKQRDKSKENQIIREAARIILRRGKSKSVDHTYTDWATYKARQLRQK